MKMRSMFTASFLSLVLSLVYAASALAQATPELDLLKQEISTLKQGQDAMRKDLAEIKKLLQARPAQAAAPQPAPFKPVDVALSTSPFQGETDAPVTIIEFTDFQCPFCGRHVRQVFPKLISEYVKTGKLKYVLREFPIASLHPAAVKASEGALCAKDQDRYWHMHAMIFNDPRKVSVDDLKALAAKLDLDVEAYAACLDSGKYAQQIKDDIAAGTAAGVRGTPSFVLGVTDPDDGSKIHATKFVRGAQPYERFEEAIEELLTEAAKKKS